MRILKPDVCSVASQAKQWSLGQIVLAGLAKGRVGWEGIRNGHYDHSVARVVQVSAKPRTLTFQLLEAPYRCDVI
ncbi:hypothetical protein E8E01_19270 [Methylorubrum populi]|uniref:hypothetical protein n=1 Tax=Methylorubrum populi TaxID=223967 RepID=UPI00114E3709|nr:hypothetical protein [Methylorubrum populi]QDI82405.1 hypothetical protein E8E01_19270 [Methylorubrum populi]